MTRYLYDRSLRLTNTIQPDNTSVINEYYPGGALRKVLGARTYPVEYTYDAQGRLKTMTTWQNHASASGAAVTTWDYHPSRGFLAGKRYPDNQGPTYTYTPAGRLQTRTWARGVTTTYGYNNAGDLETVNYSDTTPDVTYTYTRRGLPSTINSSAHQLSSAYSETGLLLSESWSSGPLAGLSVTNGYDAYSRREALALTLNSQLKSLSTYAYDPASRLRAVVAGVNSAAYSYLANAAAVEQIRFTNNGTYRMKIEKSYDGLNRLQAVRAFDSQLSALNSQLYQLNPANQRTGMTNADGSRWAYGYDSLGQVTSGRKYWSDGTPVAGQQFEYRFDDIGNRQVAWSGGDASGRNLRESRYSANSLNQYTQRTVPDGVDIVGEAQAGATVSVNDRTALRQGSYYAADLRLNNQAGPVWTAVTNRAVVQGTGSQPDRIMQTTGHQFLAQTPEAYTYDLDGNLTYDGRWKYTWDAENRLVAMEGLATIPEGARMRLTYGYDALSRRVSKSVFAWNSGSQEYATTPTTTTAYVYDGWNLVAEMSINNQPVTIIRTYAWGTDLSGTMQGAGGVGGLLMVSDLSTLNSPSLNYVVSDGNGNVTTLASASDASVTARYEYGPFGETIRATGPMALANPLRFSTKYQDAETGLLYYGYRYYSPGMGRWVNQDPIGELGGPNVYGFVYNRPVNYIDTDGRFVMEAVGVATTIGTGSSGGAGVTITVVGSGGGAVAGVVGGSVVGGVAGGAVVGAGAYTAYNILTSPQSPVIYPGNPVNAVPNRICQKCPDCVPHKQGSIFNKVTHTTHDHGNCLAKTGSMTHWHYDTVNQDPKTCKCYNAPHQFGGCGSAPP